MSDKGQNDEAWVRVILGTSPYMGTVNLSLSRFVSVPASAHSFFL